MFSCKTIQGFPNLIKCAGEFGAIAGNDFSIQLRFGRFSQYQCSPIGTTPFVLQVYSNVTVILLASYFVFKKNGIRVYVLNVGDFVVGTGVKTK
jgi:hypothetical protein